MMITTRIIPCRRTLLIGTLALVLGVAAAHGNDARGTTADSIAAVPAERVFRLPLKEVVEWPEEGLRMRYLYMEDSRCPPRVVCVWQGQVAHHVEVERHGQEPVPITFILLFQRKLTARALGYSFRLLTAGDTLPRKPPAAIRVAVSRASDGEPRVDTTSPPQDDAHRPGEAPGAASNPEAR